MSRQKIEPCLKYNLTNQNLPVQIINRDSSDSTGWFFEAILFEILQSLQIDSIQVGHREQSDSLRSQLFSGYQIDYQKIVLKINYKTPPKWTFWSQKTITREAIVKLYIKIQIITLQKTQLIWSGVLENNSIEEIPSQELKNIEYSHLDFTRAVVPNVSIYHNILEPLIIIGSTGWIIYLFFSFRSR
ncbi:hypothetical protein JW964_10595 [candidate division KSB1 bacterium]|nr:hypothetical protein [candidate division KSB1 bacterium]